MKTFIKKHWQLVIGACVLFAYGYWHFIVNTTTCFKPLDKQGTLHLCVSGRRDSVRAFMLGYGGGKDNGK